MVEISSLVDDVPCWRRVFHARHDAPEELYTVGRWIIVEARCAEVHVVCFVLQGRLYLEQP